MVHRAEPKQAKMSKEHKREIRVCSAFMPLKIGRLAFCLARQGTLTHVGVCWFRHKDHHFNRPMECARACDAVLYLMSGKNRNSRLVNVLLCCRDPIDSLMRMNCQFEAGDPGQGEE